MCTTISVLHTTLVCLLSVMLRLQGKMHEVWWGYVGLMKLGRVEGFDVSNIKAKRLATPKISQRCVSASIIEFYLMRAFHFCYNRLLV